MLPKGSKPGNHLLSSDKAYEQTCAQVNESCHIHTNAGRHMPGSPFSRNSRDIMVFIRLKDRSEPDQG
jgi:hypothetical protein